MDKEEFKDLKSRFVEKFQEKHGVPKKKKRKYVRVKGVPWWEKRRHNAKPGRKRQIKYTKELYATVERPKKEWAKPGWPPWKIMGALKQIQETPYTIAYALGIKRSHVSCVITRDYEWLWRKNLRARFRIADLLEETYEDVWGEEKPYYFARFV